MSAVSPSGTISNSLRPPTPACQGIASRIARRDDICGSGLGTVRWVVERTIAWYHGVERLHIRWERRDDIHEAFLSLTTCVICYRHVRTFG